VTKTRALSTNNIIDLYRNRKRQAKLSIRKLDRDSILIEGSATALEFLGRYLIAHARGDGSDCGVLLSPKGPGSSWFTKKATLGIYLHKLPCWQSHKLKPRA
jgi:hypothetical protein